MDVTRIVSFIGKKLAQKQMPLISMEREVITRDAVPSLRRIMDFMVRRQESIMLRYDVMSVLIASQS